MKKTLENIFAEDSDFLTPIDSESAQILINLPNLNFC